MAVGLVAFSAYPLFVAGFGWALGDRPGWADLAAGGLVIAGVALAVPPDAAGPGAAAGVGVGAGVRGGVRRADAREPAAGGRRPARSGWRPEQTAVAAAVLAGPVAVLLPVPAWWDVGLLAGWGSGVRRSRIPCSSGARGGSGRGRRVW